MPIITVTNDDVPSPIGKLKKGDKITYDGSSSSDKHCYNFYHNDKRIENRNDLLNKTLWAIDKFRKLKGLLKK
jgi:hypothetical protein